MRQIWTWGAHLGAGFGTKVPDDDGDDFDNDDDADDVEDNDHGDDEGNDSVGCDDDDDSDNNDESLMMKIMMAILFWKNRTVLKSMRTVMMNI